MSREKIKVVDKNGLVGYYFHEELMTFGTLYQGCVVQLQKQPYVVEMLEVEYMHNIIIKVRRLGR
ncbi:hypothetical protein SMUDGE_39 [Bacillus phage Smudge]|uniref:Uncharacterized protein n=3 Tax=Wphvirus megatron TaxID=1987728 RepID=A0A173H2D4_9CAUD|nr:hypothetical protein QLX47_gp044 [Bacillus phage Eyuki]YP_009284984.1 hypothetical protein BIZ88_gp042 [Bacillus phage DirtyBetty]ANI24658.1 hypothetical protein SMUDGE_39 [Bacillus phage Smudge]ASR79255.1 hypothetical protein ZAINNY_42 [Bacillus phage Zainny]ULF49249.1 hypothetical protein [Bacillus phage MrBubbles]ALA46602.1 hypothetical protein EYUKI_44 [Bacillus phage Eyuki]ANT41428.1 hypothetical protein DIRTYBETTY_42 [Bacillus phage DirtyBetty]